ncbi:hypothetical protein D3C86_1383090 [compost metagenome]
MCHSVFRRNAITVVSSLLRVSIIDRSPSHVRGFIPVRFQTVLDVIDSERMVQPFKGEFGHLKRNEDGVNPVANSSVSQNWTDSKSTGTDGNQTCLTHRWQVHMRFVHSFAVVREPILHQEQIVPRNVKHWLPAALRCDYVELLLGETPCTTLVFQSRRKAFRDASEQPIDVPYNFPHLLRSEAFHDLLVHAGYSLINFDVE